MKKIHTSGILLLFIGLITQPLNTKAQDFGELLKGSVADANTLFEGYIAPVMNGLGNGLNQGWYNTAKPHKTLGVDFTITTSLMYIPKSDETYTVDNNKLQQIKLVELDGKAISNTAVTQVPTIFGPAITPRYQIQASPFSPPPFDGPEGLDLKNTIKMNALPVPIYHLGIGIPKGFDLKLRWSPTVNLGDSRFSLWGVGVMHDIKQYIKGVKMLPFDLSGFVGYTNMKFQQSDIDGNGKDNKGILSFNSTTIQGLISKKISVLTIYGGAGFNIAKSSIKLKGTYDLDDDGATPEVKDPVNLDFSTSGFRATAGLRLKLAVFTFSGDYTLSKYNALSLGFGINVR